MSRTNRIRHEFVEFIPGDLADGVLYISIPYATAVHRCFCGCGEKVVTPVTPTDWALTFNGETVSLWPSIGNWSFSCQSHYWIKNDTVTWAPRWSRKQIEAGRRRDRFAKDHISGVHGGDGRQPDHRQEPGRRDRVRTWWRRIHLRLGRSPGQ